MPDLDHWKRFIHKLDDRFGNYVLIVICKKCGHKRYAQPEVYARIVGWKVTLDALMKRLRCSQCRAREPTWEVEREPKRKRWR